MVIYIYHLILIWFTKLWDYGVEIVHEITIVRWANIDTQKISKQTLW